MNDYLGGLSREGLEQLVRRLVEQGPEGRKVDFKTTLTLTTNSEKAEFAKDVSSIANSDDEAHLDNRGFIVIGAERGGQVTARAFTNFSMKFNQLY